MIFFICSDLIPWVSHEGVINNIRRIKIGIVKPELNLIDIRQWLGTKKLHLVSMNISIYLPDIEMSTSKFISHSINIIRCMIERVSLFLYSQIMNRKWWIKYSSKVILYWMHYMLYKSYMNQILSTLGNLLESISKNRPYIAILG